MAYPLPDKPSIAVLPFVNMTGDPKQDFISDGITDQIITYLSMFPAMFVIASNSVFTYKGKPVKVQQVAEELGVKYVLEGSVQSLGERIRVTAQLIDALTGEHLWADRYDRDRKDNFALQDEITAKLLEELNVKLLGGEGWRRVAFPENLNYYQKIRKGWIYFRLFDPKSMEQARRLYEEAITLEPEAAFAYNMLGWTFFFFVNFGTSKDPPKDMQKAFELAKKAIALNESYGDPHSLLGFLYLINHQFEKAVAEAEKAVAINPNSADSRRQLAAIYNYVGKREEAIRLAKQAIRLNPYAPAFYFDALGEASYMAGQYEEAIEAFTKALHLNPKDTFAIINLTVAYSLAGRKDEAKVMADKFLLIAPKFSVKRLEKQSLYKNPADTALVADAMRKAGFPD
jgi:adenylate cyclase